MLETSISTVVGLGSESHGGAVAATSASLLVIGARSVPGETDEDGAVATIIVVVLLLQTAGNLVVDLLVVGLGGLKGLDRGGAGVEEVETSTTEDGSTSNVDQCRRAGLLRGLGRVETTTALAESLAG